MDIAAAAAAATAALRLYKDATRHRLGDIDATVLEWKADEEKKPSIKPP